MRMPLHIFEPRYRRMLRDCLGADRMFGVVYRPANTPEADPAPGAIGCQAYIDDVEPLADGRANIIVVGHERFRVVSLNLTHTPYRVATVEAFDDAEEPVAQLTALSLRLGELFAEAAMAARALADDPAPAPELPDEPGRVAFEVAASIDLDAEARQRLLESPSASARMREVITLLDRSLPGLHGRAAVHARAKLNGRGPHTPT